MEPPVGGKPHPRAAVLRYKPLGRMGFMEDILDEDRVVLGQANEAFVEEPVVGFT